MQESIATILIVDDNSANLVALGAILEGLKQRVIKASSGAEALKILLHQECALILLDVQMPGLDGFETAALIRGRERSRDTPIIFVTAVHREEEHILKGYAHGAVDYVVKPVDPQALLAKVQVFVSQHRREQALVLEARELTRERDEMRSRETAALAGAQQQRAQLHALFMEAPAAIAILRGPEAVFELANARFEELAGTDELVGRSCLAALGELAPTVCGLVGRAQRSGTPVFATEHAIGAGRFFNSVVQSIDGLGGAGILFHSIESTETVRARSKLQEGNRRKDEFLAMLSHELRNPLACIVTALRLMKMRETGAPFLEERAVIERQASHLSRLVDDLLDVSRATLGKIQLRRERMEISNAITRAVEGVTAVVAAKQHHLAVEVPAQGLQVEGDALRLSQVFGNLLHNAAKYTPPGGSIRITGRQQGDSIVLLVRDNGIGIRPEHLSSMFDLFVQGEQSLDRAQGGLGVGLTLVRSLVELHGGSVDAQSEGLGRGTEFIVRLPAAARGDAGLTSLELSH